MLRDLSKADQSRQSIRADVAVIGGGLAGLLMASRLRRCGLRVVVLESGAASQDNERHPLNEVIHSDHVYPGAEEGRFRCLGGTSSRWGGAMLPFLSSDLSFHPRGWDVEWPVSLADLGKEFSEVERLFKLPAGTFDVEGESAPPSVSDQFQQRSAKWPRFRMRNVAYVVSQDLAQSGIDVWLNATATTFRLNESGRLAAVTAVSPTGKKLEVEAASFAIAAGAIESTRLLLLLDLQHENRFFGPDAILGRYFYDHLSASAARIRPHDRDALVNAFGLRFVHGGMRDCRLEPTASFRKKLDLPGAFSHVAAVPTNGDDGFTSLRTIYRAFQRNALPRISDLTPLFRDFGWVMEATWWRFAKGRLVPPRHAVFELMLVTEQMPHSDNKITLSSERKDSTGSPMAEIKWRIREPDLEAFRALQSALLSYWSTSPYQSFGSLTATPFEVWRKQMYEGGAIYHPGGSTRMGSSRTRGVVDGQLRTFAIPNIFVVSTSTFPSGGSANPSFMLMALALRAADRIAGDLGKRP